MEEAYGAPTGAASSVHKVLTTTGRKYALMGEMKIATPMVTPAPTPRPTGPKWAILNGGDRFEAGLTSPDVYLAQKASGESMTEFLLREMNRFPAAHTLVVADLEPDLLGEILEHSPKKADVLALEGFQSQRIDRLYEVRHGARYVTGTPERRQAKVPLERLHQALVRKPELSPEAVARKVVSRFALEGANPVVLASDTNRLQDAAPALKLLTRALLEEKAPRERLYTHLIRSSTMDNNQATSPAFRERDLVSFLSRLGDDRKLGSRINQLARQASRAVDETVLTLHMKATRAREMTVRAASAYLPWKAPHQLDNDFARDTGWNELLAYIYSGPPRAEFEPAVPKPQLGLGQKLLKAGLKGYKQYVSPYLGSSCAYTPSCSQYAREAVENHGMWEGAKMGFMRLVSCNGHSDGSDPVPSCDHGHSHSPKPKAPLPELWLNPPTDQPKSGWRKALERAYFTVGQAAGAVAGAVAGGVAGLVVGGCLGARLGWEAGSGGLERFRDDLENRYGDHKADSFNRLTDPLTTVGTSVHGLAGSLFGAPLGVLAGTLLGALGGAVGAGSWIGQMGALYGKHRAMDSVGEFPTHYFTEQVLRRDYR